MEEMLHQLIVVYPVIYKVFYVFCIPGGDRRISSINGMSLCSTKEWRDNFQATSQITPTAFR